MARSAAIALASSILVTTAVAAATASGPVVELTTTGRPALHATAAAATPAAASEHGAAARGVTEHPVDPAMLASVASRPDRGTQLVQVIRLVVTRAPGADGTSHPCPPRRPRPC